MSNQDIIATLQRYEIRTVGDLDHWRDVRRLSRWHALAHAGWVGESPTVFCCFHCSPARPQPQGFFYAQGLRASRRPALQGVFRSHVTSGPTWIGRPFIHRPGVSGRGGLTIPDETEAQFVCPRAASERNIRAAQLTTIRFDNDA